MKPERCIIPDNPPYWRDYNAVKDCREMYHRHEDFMRRYGKNYL